MLYDSKIIVIKGRLATIYTCYLLITIAKYFGNQQLAPVLQQNLRKSIINCISSFRLFNIVAYYGASPINSSSTPLPAKPILKTQGQKIILLKTNNYYQYCMKMLAFLITASEAFNGSRIEFSISGQSQSC